MRRAVAAASVAGLGVVGSLLAPTTLPLASPATGAATALAPPPAQQPRMLVPRTSAGSADSAVDVWDVVAADGAQPRWLLESAGMFGPDDGLLDPAPDYAPDGASVVYVADDDAAEIPGRRLMVADLTDLDPAADPMVQGSVLPSGWTPGTRDAEPDWSPNGEQVMFTRAGVDEDTGAGLPRRLRMLDTATGTVSDPFVDAGTGYETVVGNLEARSPAWSPDGTQLLFTATSEGDVGELWTLDLAAGEARPLVEVDGGSPVQVFGGLPAWSPDGAQLAFLDGGELVVAAVGETGDGLQRVSSRRVLADLGETSWSFRGGLAWSPDGTEISVGVDQLLGDAVLSGVRAYAVADGTQRTVVSSTTWTVLGAPDYQPFSDLEVQLESSAAEDIGLGELVQLSATVTNNGPSPAWGVVVELELPGAGAGLDLAVGWPAGCSDEGGRRSCALAEPLPAGESAELVVTVAFEESGSYTSDVRVTADSVDPLTQDNVAAVSLEVPFAPATGEEPRLAFSFEHGLGDGRRLDVADVRAADATDFRLLVDEVVTDGGGTAQPEETSPSYSPDGRQIVFSSEVHELELAGEQWYFPWDRALFVADVGPGGATNVRRLPYPRQEADHDLRPAWSPDGTQIAFARIRGEQNTQLVLVDLTTASPAVRLVEPAGWDGGAVGGFSWAPDGRRLVVDVTAGSAGPELWVVHLDDDAAYPLVRGGDGLVPVLGRSPAWSPDGSALAFESWPELVEETGTTGIFAVPVPQQPSDDGVYLVPAPELLAGAEELSGSEGHRVLRDPTWALDSQSVTYVEQLDAESPGLLLIVPSSGGEPAPLREDFPGIAAGVAEPVYQPWADVAVNLSAGTPADAGHPTALSVTVTNHGPSAASGVVLEIDVPAVAAGVATLEGRLHSCAPVVPLRCELPEQLPAGESVTVEAVLRVSEPGSHAVRAAVTTRSIDPEAANDDGLTTVEIRVPPDSLFTPRLAFSRTPGWAVGDTSSDVADVPAQGGPHDVARLLAHGALTTGTGEVLHLQEHHPHYSPDGTTLLFSSTPMEDGQPASDQRLAVGDLVPGTVSFLEPALTDIRMLPYDVVPGTSDLEAVWSPDGAQIAFTRMDSMYGFNPRVHVLDVASGQVREVALPDDVGYESSAPSWSPTGDRLAVQVSGLTEDDELWVVHLDPAGDTWYPVGEVLGDCSGNPAECFAPRWGTTPAWSPDGSRIAVGDAYVFSGGPERSAVVVHEVPAQPADGGYAVTGSRVVAGTPRGAGGDPAPGQLEAAWHPAWSPDGTELSVVGRQVEQGWDAIYSVPAEGADPVVRVSEWSGASPGSYADPAYQPWSDAHLTLAGPGRQVRAGELVGATAVVRNDGPSPAWGTSVTLTLPAGLEDAGWDGSCTRAGSVLTCRHEGPLAAGAEYRVGLTFRAGQPGTYEIAGELATTTLDPAPSNDTATLQLDVGPVAPPEGIEPRLAFTYRPGDPGQEEQTDIADVLGAEGSDFRVIAQESVTDPAGRAHRAEEEHPSYSPDGRRMVFSAARTLAPEAGSAGGVEQRLDDGRTLMVADTRPGATGLVNVVPLDYERPEGARDVHPAWSPDGTRIAFVRHHGEDVWLALADVATGAVRYVEELRDHVYWINHPTWSPEGDRLIIDGTEGAGSLWVIHLDDEQTELFPVVVEPQICDPGSSGCQFVAHEPSVSPDGTRLAFLDHYRTAAGEHVEGLFVAELPAAPVAGAYRLGPPERVVGPDPQRTEPLGEEDLVHVVRSPVWALDGRSLAFVGDRLGEEESSVLYTVPAGGGTPEVLRAEVRQGVRHTFSDLEYQPWADVGVSVVASAPQTPTGEPIDLTVRVTNHGPSPAWGVGVVVGLPQDVDRTGTLPAGCVTAGSLLTCTGPEALPVGSTESYVLTLAPEVPGEYAARARVHSRMIDPAADNDAAAVTFRAGSPAAASADLALSLELGQPTGWVGGDPVPATLVVTNEGPTAAEDVALSLTFPEGVEPAAHAECPLPGECLLGALAADTSATIVLDLLPVAEGAGAVTAIVHGATPDPEPANDTATAELTVHQPVLRLLPSVATPGEATLAYGTDFPPGAEIDLRWDRGITAWARPVTAGEDGTVRAPMLVLPGDELGQRLLLATSAAGPGFGEPESPALLVVPRTMSPPDFLTRGR